MTPQITPKVAAVYRHFGSRKLFAEHLYLCYGLYNRAPLVSIKSGIRIEHRAWGIELDYFGLRIANFGFQNAKSATDIRVNIFRF
jgi:hypothetical protein